MPTLIYSFIFVLLRLFLSMCVHLSVLLFILLYFRECSAKLSSIYLFIDTFWNARWNMPYPIVSYNHQYQYIPCPSASSLYLPIILEWAEISRSGGTPHSSHCWPTYLPLAFDNRTPGNAAHCCHSVSPWVWRDKGLESPCYSVSVWGRKGFFAPKVVPHLPAPKSEIVCQISGLIQ